MKRKIETISVLVPNDYMTFNYRRHKKDVKVTLLILYTEEDDVEVLTISGQTEDMQNLTHTDCMYKFLCRYSQEYVKNLLSVNLYELQAI